MPGGRERSILPLPEEVVAQIKSSTAVVSLTGVVLELLKNSLDAKATHIEATVDFARGGCLVEDNGLGIAPSEFREDGGFGKLYCTSKFYSEEASLGRNGTFLASLAAMCLLTVTSLHHAHRRHNLLTLHHSKVIDRQLPAKSGHDIHGNQGTRVTVRNLFGNLPVRVKRRALLSENKAENARLWEVLKKDVAGLLLAWQGEISLKVRDVQGQMSLSFSTGARMDPARSHPSELHSMLSVLTQANYIHVDDWSSWVHASASTPTISIAGAISLDPAPHKRVQFISLGIRPVSAEPGHNELYDEVNRIFSQSSFGTIEDDHYLQEDEKVRRENDKRYKSDDYTNKQLKARKGVDRYPMFHLRISLKDGNNCTRPEHQLIEDDSNVKAVADVLNAMITQWLSVHHLRPRESRKRYTAKTTCSVSDAGSLVETSSDAIARSLSLPPATQARSNVIRPNSSAQDSNYRKRKRPRPPMAMHTLEQPQNLSFTEWSRIKSSKPGVFSRLEPLGGKENILQSDDAVQRSRELVDPVSATTLPQDPNHFSQFDNKPVLAGSLNDDFEPSVPREGQEGPTNERHDGTITWEDPLSKQIFFLNARTGCSLLHKPDGLLSDPSLRRHEATLKDFSQKRRLEKKPSTSCETSIPWLNDILNSWDNPVFRPVEKGIPQSCLHKHQSEDQTVTHLGASLHQANTTFSAFSSCGNKLTKSGLENAQILAQVDKKFILVKIESATDAPLNIPATQTLVLIDQHAADERVQVEALLAELCMPLPYDEGQCGYRSELGHRSHVSVVHLEKPIQFTISDQERMQFMAFAATFAAWGILFNIEPAKSVSGRQQSVLSVVTLPPTVSERCKSDPPILIDLLRSAVWKYADAPISASQSHISVSNHDDDSVLWVKRLSSCPEGLVGLVNSRACRSAIMFNDELSLEQCQGLVQRLSKCVFPFMCAHGRPSMAPIADLGALGGEDNPSIRLGVDAEPKDPKGYFVGAWKAWNNK